MDKMYENQRDINKIPLWIYVLENIYNEIQRKRQTNDKYLKEKETTKFENNYKNL